MFSVGSVEFLFARRSTPFLCVCAVFCVWDQFVFGECVCVFCWLRLLPKSLAVCLFTLLFHLKIYAWTLWSGCGPTLDSDSATIPVHVNCIYTKRKTFPNTIFDSAFSGNEPHRWYLGCLAWACSLFQSAFLFLLHGSESNGTLGSLFDQCERRRASHSSSLHIAIVTICWASVYSQFVSHADARKYCASPFLPFFSQRIAINNTLLNRIMLAR